MQRLYHNLKPQTSLVFVHQPLLLYTGTMSYWSFAIVNGKLAEIFYDKIGNSARRIDGHCYVKAGAYKTKQEEGWIKKDTQRMRFSFRNKKYAFLGKSSLRYTTGGYKEL